MKPGDVVRLRCPSAEHHADYRMRAVYEGTRTNAELRAQGCLPDSEAADDLSQENPDEAFHVFSISRDMIVCLIEVAGKFYEDQGREVVIEVRRRNPKLN